MSIGIDFVLRMSSAAFTKGVASANNSIKDLKKSLREGDAGHGLKQLLGAGAIIAGFRAVINHAQETRKALEDMGKSVPETTRQIAEMSDALDDLKKFAMSAGTTAIGFFTDLGSKVGDTINGWRKEMGGQLVDPETGRKISADAEAQIAAANAAKKKQLEANSVENLIKLDKDLAATRKANAQADMGRLEKLAALRAEEQALIEKGLTLRQNKNALNGHIDDAAIKVNSIALEKKTGEREAAERNAANLHDKYQMNVEQLSNSVITEGMDPKKRKAIMDAKSIMQLEGMANQQGFAGDFSGSDLSLAKANKLRQGLSGFVTSTEVNKDKDFAAPIVDQLKELNGKVKSGVLVY